MHEQRMTSRTAASPPEERLLDYIYCRIVEHKESPEVVAFRMKKEGLDYAVCAKTIYNLIDQGKVPSRYISDNGD